MSYNTLIVLDANGANQYLAEYGAGTGVSPFIPPVSLDMVGGVAIGSGNPVPVNIAQLGGVSVNFAQETGGHLASLDSKVTACNTANVSAGGFTVVASGNFTRPADTTAYTSGDLIANNTTAASVVPVQFTVARVAAGSGMIRRARLTKSGLVVTNATFRLHLYTADPSASTGIANGDNGAWSTNRSGYLGSFDLDMTVAVARVFRDSAQVTSTPNVGSEINFALPSGQVIYGLLEARAAYTPASAEVFTIDLEIIQN